MNIGFQPQQNNVNNLGFNSNQTARSNPKLSLIKTQNLAQILPPATNKDFKSGAIAITNEANAAAGQLYKAKIANIFNQDWTKIVSMAVKSNGGMGTPDQGFLAWSKDGNFVRLNNPRLKPEENQKLAEISLKSGIAVEDLPSRWETQSTTDPKVSEKLNIFINDFETKFQAMAEGKSAGLQVKDKKHIFSMQLDPKSGAVVSDHQKEPSGIRKFMGKALKYAGPVLDIVSKVAAFIPGWGTLVAAGAAALKWGMQSVATGKAKFQGLISAAATAVSGYVGGASSWLSDSVVGKAIGSVAGSSSWGEALKNVGNIALEWGKEKVTDYVGKWLGSKETKESTRV